MTVTIDKFGRILIPKQLRERLGLTPGTEFDLDVRDEGDGPALELRPDRAETGLVYEGDLLVFRGKVGAEAHDLNAFIQAQRDRRVSHLAGLDQDDMASNG
ncbi:MAG: AbrB/MazE/SpoVT family DNA-binding domain-containing protein [Bacteroidota bacterium]